jgi:hypothetical protein
LQTELNNQENTKNEQKNQNNQPKKVAAGVTQAEFVTLTK